MVAKLPRVSKKAYELRGDIADALLLHGYTGSPYDLRPVGNFLSTHGIAVSAPLLRGHGTKPADLLSSSANDWYHDAQIAFNRLAGTRPIIVGGLSMGALLAIILAAEEPAIDGLLLLSPSLKLSKMAELTILSAQLGILDKSIAIKKLSGSDIADPDAKSRTPSYAEMPVKGLVELERLRVLAREKLRSVTCPIFVAFGKNDDAIDANESHRMIVDDARAPIISKFYTRSKHVISLDYDRESLCADIARFLTDNCGIAL